MEAERNDRPNRVWDCVYAYLILIALGVGYGGISVVDFSQVIVKGHVGLHLPLLALQVVVVTAGLWWVSAYLFKRLQPMKAGTLFAMYVMVGVNAGVILFAGWAILLFQYTALAHLQAPFNFFSLKAAAILIGFCVAVVMLAGGVCLARSRRGATQPELKKDSE